MIIKHRDDNTSLFDKFKDFKENYSQGYRLFKKMRSGR